MKYLAVILLMVISDASIAQVKNPGNRDNPEPVYIIDSVKKAKTYFEYLDPNAIASFNVFKNQQYPDGVIYVTSKDHNQMAKFLQSPLLSLNDLSNANIAASERSKPVLYMLDDRLLTDTAAIRIPAICIHKVTVIKASETAYFKTALPNILLMKISTKPPVIEIRGIAAKN